MLEIAQTTIKKLSTQIHSECSARGDSSLTIYSSQAAVEEFQASNLFPILCLIGNHAIPLQALDSKMRVNHGPVKAIPLHDGTIGHVELQRRLPNAIADMVSFLLRFLSWLIALAREISAR